VILYHYTDKDGYNAIRASSPWHFRAERPPGDHPLGAYFTCQQPSTPKLAKRLQIPVRKLEYVFAFEDKGDLKQLRGDRGKQILYSPEDYYVESERQLYCGKVDDHDWRN
jgi:hypothetical protein